VSLPANIKVRIPSTSANLGPGFDLFGLAIDCYNTFEIRYTEDFRFPLFDSDSTPIAIPEENNLVRRAYIEFLNRKGVRDNIPGLSTSFHNDLPLGSGFGSSAAAIIAGTAAAIHYLSDIRNNTVSLDEEIRFLTDQEGHPDNVCPARIGGFVFSAIMPDGRVRTVVEIVPESLGLAVIVPNFQISTKKSRTRLPAAYPLKDVLSNIAGSLLWLNYLRSGDPGVLIDAIHLDRLHEPYRGESIPGFFEFRDRIETTGCYGATISGSGPGILIYYPADKCDSIIPLLNRLTREIFHGNDLENPVRICKPDYTGLTKTILE
jgi:homoserine kinase